MKKRAVAAVGLSSFVVLTAAFVSPVFGWAFPRTALGWACHQEPLRCLFVAGGPMALCARCVAIYTGLCFGSGLAFLLAPSRSLALHLLAFSVSVTAVDLLAEWTGLYENLVAVRLVTGWSLGSAVALMIGSRERYRTNPLLFHPTTPVQT